MFKSKDSISRLLRVRSHTSRRWNSGLTISVFDRMSSSRDLTGGSSGVTVNVTVDGGAPALLRSEAQIAQMMARAAALGARRL